MPKSEADRIIRSNDLETTYNITIEVLDRLVGGRDATKQRLEQIDFSAQKFQLLSLSGLEFIGHHNPEDRLAVQMLAVGNNQLTSLLELVPANLQGPLFPNVENIFAPSNYIRNICSSRALPMQNSWPAKMEQLVELDLSNNLLEIIPDLRSMPKLRKLRLKNNSIRPPWKRLQGGKQLENIDLSDNCLDWTEKEFMKELVLLRDLHLLRELHLAGNPFSQDFPDYYLYCMKEISTSQEAWLGRGSKKRYNIEKLDEHECTVALYEAALNLEHPERKRQNFLKTIGDSSDLNKLSKEREDEYFESLLRNAATVEDVNLYRMNLLVEKCYEDPQALVTCTNTLYKMATNVRDRQHLNVYLFDEMVPLVFQQDNEEKRKYEFLVVKLFIQNVAMAIQSQKEIIVPLLRVCCVLSGTPDSKGILGLACMEFLASMAQGEGECANAVVQAIKDCIVPQLQTPTRNSDMYESAKPVLLKGLTNFVKSTNLTEPLTMIVPEISLWLRERNSASQAQLILKAAAAVVSEARAARTFGGSEGFLTAVINLWESGGSFNRPLKHTDSRGTEEYSNLLFIIQNVSEFDVVEKETKANGKVEKTVEYRSALFIRKHGFHMDLLDHMDTALVALVDLHSLRKEEYLASIIQCLMKLCCSRKVLYDVLSPTNKYMKKLKSLVSISLKRSSRVLPQVIAATFSWMHAMLRSTHFATPIAYHEFNVVLTLEAFQKEVISTLSIISVLLSYISETDARFARVCELLGQNNGVMDPNGRRLPLAMIENKHIHEMIKTAINLIYYFSSLGHAVSPDQARYVERLLVELDEHSREKHLFNCLSVKDDTVRLAAIRCLNATPLEHFDMDEVQKLLTIMASSVDIAAGETEMILSSGFDLLSRLVLFKGSVAIRNFRLEGGLGEMAIRIAWDILLRNSSRRTSDNPKDDIERFNLSQSIVRFFHACSVWNETEANRFVREIENSETIDMYERESLTFPFREYLLKGDVMENFVKIMCKENALANFYSGTHASGIRTKFAPILLENTYVGRQVEFLITAIEGWNTSLPALNPRGQVVARLLRRAANILCGVPDLTLDQQTEYWTKYTAADPPEATSSLNEDTLRMVNADTIDLEKEYIKKIVSRCREVTYTSFAKGSWNTSDEIHSFDGLYEKFNTTYTDPSKNPRYSFSASEPCIRFPQLDFEEEMEYHLETFGEWDLTQSYGVSIRDHYEERHRIMQHESFAKYGGAKRVLDAILFSSKLHSNDTSGFLFKSEAEATLDALFTELKYSNIHESPNKEKQESNFPDFAETMKSEIDAPAREPVGLGRLLVSAFLASDIDDELIQDQYTTTERETLVHRVSGFFYDILSADPGIYLSKDLDDAELNYSSVTPSASIAPLLRLLNALVNLGTAETTEQTKQLLRDEIILTRLVKTCIGDHTNNMALYTPHFLQYNLGAKLMVLLKRVLDYPIQTARLPSTQLVFIEIVMTAANLFLEVVNFKLDDYYAIGTSSLPIEYLNLAAYTIATMAHVAQLITMKSISKLPSDVEVESEPMHSTDELCHAFFPFSTMHILGRLLEHDNIIESSLKNGAIGNPGIAISKSRKLRDMMRSASIEIFSCLIANDSSRRYTKLEIIAKVKCHEFHLCTKCYQNRAGGDPSEGDLGRPGCHVCNGATVVPSGLRQTLISEILRWVKVHKSIKDIKESRIRLDSIFRQDQIPGETIVHLDSAMLVSGGQDSEPCIVVLTNKQFKCMKLDESENLLNSIPSHGCGIENLKRVVPGFWHSNLHINFVIEGKTFTVTLIFDTPMAGKKMYDIMFRLCQEVAAERTMGKMVNPSFKTSEDAAPVLESDSFLTLSFQKRLVPLHKNAGKFDIVYCTPIYFYRYDNDQAVFRLEGLRVLTFTDCDNFVCFKVAIDNWVMPLFWEQEEENFRLETLRRLEEKRLRARQHLSIESQRRQWDQLNQLRSQFKSELETEKARQDKKMKKVLTQDERIPPFKLNEITEINSSDEVSPDNFPCVVLGLNMSMQATTHNVLLEFGTKKIVSKAKKLYMFRFCDDSSYVPWKRLFADRLKDMHLPAQENGQHQSESFYEKQAVDRATFFKKQGEEIKKMNDKHEEELNDIVKNTRRKLSQIIEDNK
jgi:hypothetical protein